MVINEHSHLSTIIHHLRDLNDESTKRLGKIREDLKKMSDDDRKQATSLFAKELQANSDFIKLLPELPRETSDLPISLLKDEYQIKIRSLNRDKEKVSTSLKNLCAKRKKSPFLRVFNLFSRR